MRGLLLLLLFLALIHLAIFTRDSLISGFVILGRGKEFSHERSYVEGEVIVKFKEVTDPKAFVKIAGISSKLAEKMEELRLRNTYLLKLKQGISVESAIEELKKSDVVEHVQPNYVYKLLNVEPNDPYFAEQWYLTKINATTAWEIERGNESVVIAVIDTGIDLNHVDINHSNLTTNLWNNVDELLNGQDDDGNGYIDDIFGWNFVDNNSDVSDTHGHGTHVAGIIAAVTNNSIGIAGICWNCKLMILKAFDSNGNGTTVAIANAIYYAANNGAKIISMSFGGNGSDEILQEALNYASSNGILLVAAAGNDGSETKNYPAAYDNVIAVAATNESDERASFSQFGAWIDLAAPGTNILSTWPNDMLAYANGTSMSTPIVSGIAALLLSKNPNLTPLQLYTALKSSVTRVKSERYIGTGVVNAWLALSRESDAIALLNHSLRGGVVTGIVNLTGIANASSLVNYSLCWGNGTYPENFTCFYTGTSNVTSDSLGLWDTRDIIEANVTLRLIVRDSFGESFDEALVEVRNAKITWPTDGAFITDKQIQINATFAKHKFANYTLYYCNETNCTLLDQSSEIPSDATLATWNVSGLYGNYTIHLEVNYEDGIVAIDNITLTLDPALVKGFPLDLENASSALSYDLDNDRRWEIVSLSSENGTILKVLEGTTTKASIQIQGEVNCITFAELTGDGDIEILVPVLGENSSLITLSHNLSLLRNVSVESSSLSCIAASDIDVNNELEFIVLDFYNNATYAFFKNENRSANLANLSFERNTSAAIGNLTPDEGNEIVVAVRNESGSGIAVLNSTLGLNYLHFDYRDSGVILETYQPLLVERFGDGRYSIVYFLLNETINESTYEVLNRALSFRVLDYNGSDLVISSSIVFEGARLLASPAAFYSNSSYRVVSLQAWRNFSSQEQSEIIRLVLLDLNGSVVESRDLLSCSACLSAEPIVIGKESEMKLIIAYGSDSSSKLEVYDTNNLTQLFSREVPGSPRWCGVADLNGSGEASVLLLTNDKLYAWEIPSALSKKELLWLNGGFVNRDFTLHNWSRLPSFEGFDGTTTRFEFLTDLTNVANATLERKGYGRIVFNGTLDFTSLDLDRDVNISKNFIGINTSSLPQLNTSAMLMLTDLNFYYPIIQVVDESNLSKVSDCDFCERLSYFDGTLWFRVEHFSYFTTREANARLEIWDDSNHATTSVNRTMKFYANFTNFTSGIVITNASCTLIENSTGDWREFNMSFNESSELYELSLIFGEKLEATFIVRCNASQLGYDVLELQDGFVVNNTPPTRPELIKPLNYANLSSTNVTFEFSSSDPDGDNITYSIYVNSSKLAETNETSYTSLLLDGTYTWFVVASDGFAETMSESYTFTIDSTPPKVVNFSLTPRLVINGSNITIFVKASDEHLDKILLDVASNEANYSYFLTNGEPHDFTVPLPGDYKVTIYLNDTFGNEASINDSFKARLPAEVNFSILSPVEGVVLDLVLVHEEEIVESHSFNESLSLIIPSEIYNITGRAFDSTLTFLVESVNLSSDESVAIGLDKLTNYEEFTLVYVIDVRANFSVLTLNLSYAEISVTNEDLLKLYKCDDWDLSSRACMSGWSEITATKNEAIDRFTIVTHSLSAFGIREETPVESTTTTTSPTEGGTIEPLANETTSTTTIIPEQVEQTTTLTTIEGETTITTTLSITTTTIVQRVEARGEEIQLLVYLLVISVVASVGTFVLYRMLKAQREEERLLRKLELRKDIDRIEEAVVKLKMRGIRTGEIERELELARRALESDDLDSAEIHLERALLLLQKYVRTR